MGVMSLLGPTATSSGAYTIDPLGEGGYSIYCDQERLGGGWTNVARTGVNVESGRTDDAVGTVSADPVTAGSCSVATCGTSDDEACATKTTCEAETTPAQGVWTSVGGWHLSTAAIAAITNGGPYEAYFIDMRQENYGGSYCTNAGNRGALRAYFDQPMRFASKVQCVAYWEGGSISDGDDEWDGTSSGSGTYGPTCYGHCVKSWSSYFQYWSHDTNPGLVWSNNNGLGTHGCCQFSGTPGM